MIRRRLLAGFAVALALAGCGQKEQVAGPHPKELAFAIPSAENQTAMQPLWRPLTDDLSKSIGVKVKPYFASNYTSLVEAIRFGQVQAGWYSARPALEAVNRADAEVLARVVEAGGDAAYRSVLIARTGRNITLDAVLKCGGKLSFGVGEAESISGTLAPMTYLFTPKGVEPAKCFKAVRAASHQANFVDVATGVVDVATNNTVGVLAAQREHPQLADKVEVIWTSPPLPEASILVRKDLDPALKEKIRQFFITYGTGTGFEADREREVLKKLAYGGFRPADDSYLDPIREMAAAQTLADARKSGDKAKIAAAQAQFDKVQAAAAQRRAANPDV
ncbi:MAG TPA: phosphate/phosphite/phosphonate ABC transporter substrate-binding protein [Phenylobacterium sp.]|uniref:phosphate/phosphite/phosphonate ABC transporter substrate-binding protein n=1 Tax=Phenylobacterium sp. TaxID=1871053 RepID=UPI002B4953AD|nr:phosphate/phosphite/phosphonate ABC transporter substrate-binding protein [Phenylobacterium sp.]HKR86749.1 phosphate/phosphite/phosphonate ABC transporter substrate-binding protein [Phenylobacterium sp.]